MGGQLYSSWMLIGSAGVDLFFVISGFVMVHVTKSNFESPGTATKFAVSRISRVYPPYWVLTFLVFLLWIYSPSSINSKSGGADPITSFLLLPSKTLPLVPVAWTLVHEVFFYFCFWLFIVFGRRRYLPSALIIWGVVSAINAAIFWIDPTYAFRGLLFSPLNAEFCIGGLLALSPKKGKGWIFIILGFAIFATISIYFEMIRREIFMHDSVRIAYFLIPSALVVYGALVLEINKIIPSVWLAQVGEWSYSLYLVHILIIHSIYRVFRMANINSLSEINLILLLAVLFLSSMVISYIFHKHVEMPSTIIFRNFLTGILVQVRKFQKKFESR